MFLTFNYTSAHGCHIIPVLRANFPRTIPLIYLSPSPIKAKSSSRLPPLLQRLPWAHHAVVMCHCYQTESQLFHLRHLKTSLACSDFSFHICADAQVSVLWWREAEILHTLSGTGCVCREGLFFQLFSFLSLIKMYESTDFRMALVINVSLHNGSSEVCSQIAMFWGFF